MEWIVGVDEAGRGPLAGPVTVGVFAMPDFFDPAPLLGIRDSKVLSERMREVWYDTLTTLEAVRYAVGSVDAEHIDRHGISHAIRHALLTALTVLSLPPERCRVLLDGGLRAPHEYTRQTTIIRGDATEPCISAAAILAKVTRDKCMVEYDREWSGYGFAIHKGYGTQAHRDFLRTRGMCPIHRRTFCRRISAQGGESGVVSGDR